MKTNKFLFGIYAQDILLSNLLHNKLEHLMYEVTFSCSSLKDLHVLLNEQPALLIFSTTQPVNTINPEIIKIREQCPKMKLLVVINQQNAKVKQQVINDGDYTTIINSSFRQLAETLEKILPDHPIHFKPEINAIKILPGNPFYKIQNDPEKLTVFKMLSQGKSTKQIAGELKKDYYHIEAIRRQIIHETHSSNIVESVAKAKDVHLF